MEYLRAHFREGYRHWTGEEWSSLPAVGVFDRPEYLERSQGDEAEEGGLSPQGTALPAVVIANATGETLDLAFDQDLGVWTDTLGTQGEAHAVYQVIGGWSSFTVSISCGAYEEEVQQLLTDLTGLYLLLGKFYSFWRGKLLIDQVRFLGETQISGEPGQALIFEGRLSARVSADWRSVYPVETIKKIDVDARLVMDI